MAVSTHSSPPSDSDNEYESEEDANPYPLEGKYVDEEDRERWVSTTTIDVAILI